jgi:hypothetical protein
MKLKIQLGFIAVIVLSASQAALRLFFGLSTTGVLGSTLQTQVRGMIEVPMTNGDWTFLAAAFILLGIGGAVSLVGLLGKTNWGYYGTVALCAATIIYDAWALFAIQSSALIGIVLPAALIAFMVVKKDRFLHSGATGHESTSGVRN